MQAPEGRAQRAVGERSCGGSGLSPDPDPQWQAPTGARSEAASVSEPAEVGGADRA
jgi:hypothetical protein